LSVSEDRTVQPATTAPATGIADPAPLGLAAFAATTFLLSAANAGWMTKATGDAWLGYAFTYGGFWIGLGLWALLVAPKAASPEAANHDIAWILLTFAIINTYLLILSTQVNLAVFLVFLTLEITEIVLFIGNFGGSTGTVKFGGYVGLVTALVAFYASAAGISNGLAGKLRFPVGRALIS
jgi:succinate-acetate transporter protein